MEAAVQALGKRIDDLEKQSNDGIPPIVSSVTSVTTKLTAVEQDIQDHTVAFKRLDQTVTALAAGTAPSIEATPKLLKAVQDLNDMTSKLDSQMTDVTLELSYLNTKMTSADVEFRQHRDWSRQNVSSLMDQIQAAGSKAGRPGTTTPYTRRLDEAKVFEKFVKATGLEPLGDLVEWFERLTININSIIPSTHAILTELSRKQGEIDGMCFKYLPTGPTTRLDAELYSLLATLCTGKAWSYLKTKECAGGLETFRFIFYNLTKRIRTQLLDEFRYLNSPHGPNTCC